MTSRTVSPATSPAMAVPTFHALYAAGFFGAASPSSSPLPWPSTSPPGLGSQLAPDTEWGISARQASLHMRIVQLLIRAVHQASPPLTKATSRVAQRVVGVQNDPIDTVIIPLQQVAVSLRHWRSRRTPEGPVSPSRCSGQDHIPPQLPRGPNQRPVHAWDSRHLGALQAVVGRHRPNSDRPRP